ncbi:hypothetical protein WT56_13340 [Burkholderia pseudomultivorans]|uniref:Uncharacterized protein n=2 Tax=Burkholderia pseudomultivorans TaxID=1207504 RepID=A0A132EJI8_9BURK|nr:hypothetical protein WT56_13340 [Burkholderia pseudomultivorans]
MIAGGDSTEHRMTFSGFRYHPDPLSTGSGIRSDERFAGCSAVRGCVFAGPACVAADDERYIYPSRD